MMACKPSDNWLKEMTSVKLLTSACAVFVNLSHKPSKTVILFHFQSSFLYSDNVINCIANKDNHLSSFFFCLKSGPKD